LIEFRFTMTETSRLFTLITSCQWKEVADYLQINGAGEAKIMMNTGKRGAAKISALQAVLAHPKCKGKAPLGLVQTLLEIAPEMALQNHLYTGNFPLHAVFYNAFFSSTKRRTIAEMIITACPSTILLRNSEGRTALHTNCSQHCNYEPIVTLLKAAPQIVTWRDNHGDTPLHLACKSLKSPNKSIQVLFDLYPQGMFVRNAQGSTPLEATIASGLPRAKLIPRINFIKDLEGLAATRVQPSSERKKELIKLPINNDMFHDKSFLNSTNYAKNNNISSHHNVSQDDISIKKSKRISFIPRKRLSESDLHNSTTVKRQAIVKLTPNGVRMTNVNSHNFTPAQNITFQRTAPTTNTGTINVLTQTNLDKNSMPSSPTSVLNVDLFCNTDTREDIHSSSVERNNGIKWQAPRHRNFHYPSVPASPDHYYYYYNHSINNTSRNIQGSVSHDDNMKRDITSTACILSMMRNSKSCEQF